MGARALIRSTQPTKGKDAAFSRLISGRLRIVGWVEPTINVEGNFKPLVWENRQGPRRPGETQQRGARESGVIQDAGAGERKTAGGCRTHISLSIANSVS